MFFLTRCLLATLLVITTTVSARELQFQPEKYFAGRTRSTGVFRNTIGKPEERFSTNCRGRMRGSTLYLDQRFRYDDGRTQERHWQIRRVDATHYLGRANDVVGAARGAVTGSSFHFVYTVALNRGNPLLNVRLDQTMTLRRDGILENHATIRKIGVPVSRVTEQFRRVD
ncbi:MAG: DUF3833 family protein [Chthoniobacterales bacterium]